MKSIQTKEETFNSMELVELLHKLCYMKKFKKPLPMPVFTFKEAMFIADLIFYKPKDLVYFYIMDHIRNQTDIGQMGLFSARGFRLHRFFVGFLKYMGNSTKAAIYAGYSPRSAKQQGYRALKRWQKYYRSLRN